MSLILDDLSLGNYRKSGCVLYSKTRNISNSRCLKGFFSDPALMLSISKPELRVCYRSSSDVEVKVFGFSLLKKGRATAFTKSTADQDQSLESECCNKN